MTIFHPSYVCWLFFTLIFACQAKHENSETSDSTSTDASTSIEAITLFGDTLHTPEAEPGKALDNYVAAKKAQEENPNDAEALIWYGRRTAYLGQFQKAIEVYTSGISQFPADARFYRHRGHRYISTRQYDKAIADFEKAASLIEGQEDEIEPDGLPNERNIPLSTLHGNIWYHLGLAHYLQNNMEKALEAYSNRTVTHKYDDNIVSGAYWLYMINRRLGRDSEAEEVLQEIKEGMDIIENTSYYKMCLFYKGLLQEQDLKPEGPGSASNDVFSYGLGNWYLHEQSDTSTAKAYFKELLAKGNKFSFAYLAAESDLKRIQE